MILFSLYKSPFFLTLRPLTLTRVSSVLSLPSFHFLSWFAYYSHICWAYNVAIGPTVNKIKKTCTHMWVISEWTFQTLHPFALKKDRNSWQHTFVAKQKFDLRKKNNSLFQNKTYILTKIYIFIIHKSRLLINSQSKTKEQNNIWKRDGQLAKTYRQVSGNEILITRFTANQ